MYIAAGYRVKSPGTDLEDLLRPGFLESYSMFFPDRHHGSIKLAGTSGLEILPRGVSVPLVVRFRSDGLPVSAEAPGFRVVFQGWNEYLGVQIAQAWTSGATGTENSFSPVPRRQRAGHVRETVSLTRVA